MNYINDTRDSRLLLAEIERQARRRQRRAAEREIRRLIGAAVALGVLCEVIDLVLDWAAER